LVVAGLLSSADGAYRLSLTELSKRLGTTFTEYSFTNLPG